MPGSDFVRPGLYPRANLNIGIGHTFKAWKANKLGDEGTFSYTYENAGSHGFWHTSYGAHTESVGLMRNLQILKLGIYTWQQVGITEFTGPSVTLKAYLGTALGATYHFTPHQGVWFQESLNEVVGVPWYTTTSLGYVVSF